MIRHVAVFRFVPTFTAQQREDWMSLLRALPAQIPELRALTVGSDVLGGEFSHDLALVADFDDLEGLAAYNRHPAHAEVLRVSAPVKVSLATVDFELPDIS
ncbi:MULTISPECIES: Dabb family protein [unclassified Microbacterium]|uniref:Dabb family protein n=1 Tax=unclassified Microbacterium TaxID=2609290 RepID=UPI00214AE11D|nr:MULTISPECIES: Dabb family protein [unclassified Microbacterium]MCR2785946.1 Dabb family protein [Microbacterium sp. zg.B96]MDL5353160.1 Dabb family protein [Microbacterium sp. zg-YB36]WIM17082.1 Dabb family protein [Microbacterium sp. zg-B96]